MISRFRKWFKRKLTRVFLWLEYEDDEPGMNDR